MQKRIRFPMPREDVLAMAERCWNTKPTPEQERAFEAREAAEEVAYRAKVGRPMLWEIRAQQRAAAMGAANDAI